MSRRDDWDANTEITLMLKDSKSKKLSLKK